MIVSDQSGNTLCVTPDYKETEEVVAHYRHHYFYNNPGSPQVVQVKGALYDLWGDLI